MPKNRVLIPLNQSELSQQILPHVEKFIPAQENDLILFYVTNPPSNVGLGEPDLSAGYLPLPGEENITPALHPIYATQQEDSIRAHVEAELIPVTHRLKEAGYEFSLVVGFGKDPVETILREISEKKINLVAMSTLARVGVTRFFFRNIADTIAREANLPVLLAYPAKR
ncbi:MAG: universal stress protein [Gammaproteobacteria bacterium]|nr:universal stress protein [Gammaproteobacteria bacterium]MDH3857640.1 universal stress protein [Gammaproteobacteria bacterium]